jgi:NAD(P)-dependent dehydrogenase (short-subunit alcohol dehydrogenase family)
MTQDFDGKRALVTGASSGIGRSIALALASRGASVALHARSEEKAAGTLDAITRTGGNAFALAADMAQSTEIKAMCETALDRLGGLDIVVNNAGFFGYGAVTEMSEAFWDAMMDVDLKAPFLVTKYTLPALLDAAPGSSLLFMASSSSRTADANFACYNAAKHGLLGFARSVAAEAGAQGVQVNALCPGWIETKMATEFFESWPGEKPADFETFRETDMAGANMLKRVGQPEDIAAMAVYLASEKGRFITGQAIGICGGLAYW